MYSFSVLFIAAACLFLIASMRIVKEDERLAVFVFGRFVGIKGPGLVICFPGSMTVTRVQLRAVGEVQSSALVLVDGAAIPFAASTALHPGTKVRISGFENASVRVEPIENYVTCQKCGHKNAL